MSRLCLYYIQEPERDRWVRGDRHWRPLVRRLIRGAPRPGGVDKVFINLSLGLQKLQIPYEVNLPFAQLRADDRVGVLGRGRFCLRGYDRPNPIVAGVALMTYPSEWPNLCEEYPVAKYLQHSAWANDVYKPYFGDRCEIWPVGIHTDEWSPANPSHKTVDFLIYDKIRWNYERVSEELSAPIRALLRRRGLSFEELRYGYYRPEEYRAALARCRAMIFLCEHESQGIAYQECLSSDVPVLAWDQGKCLDPERFTWGIPEIPATSVPYWDERCGIKFKDASDFPSKLEQFLEGLKQNLFKPRDYILENLTLEKCAGHYVDLLNEVQGYHA